MTIDASSWLERYAEMLGLTAPSSPEREALLELAATAAHASERIAAPLSCWLAASAGRTPAEALEVARELANEIEHQG